MKRSFGNTRFRTIIAALLCACVVVVCVQLHIIRSTSTTFAPNEDVNVVQAWPSEAHNQGVPAVTTQSVRGGNVNNPDRHSSTRIDGRLHIPSTLPTPEVQLENVQQLERQNIDGSVTASLQQRGNRGNSGQSQLKHNANQGAATKPDQFVESDRNYGSVLVKTLRTGFPEIQQTNTTYRPSIRGPLSAQNTEQLENQTSQQQSSAVSTKLAQEPHFLSVSTTPELAQEPLSVPTTLERAQSTSTKYAQEPQLLSVSTTLEHEQSVSTDVTKETRCPNRVRVISASGHDVTEILSFVHHLASHLGVQEPVRFLHVENRYADSEYDVSRYFLDKCEFNIVLVPRTVGLHQVRDLKRRPITKVGIIQWAIQQRALAKQNPENLLWPPEKQANSWHNEVFWNSGEPMVKLVNQRPLLIHAVGAPFRSYRSHEHVDVVLNRARQPIQGTLTGHILEFNSRGWVDQDMDPMIRSNLGYNAALLQQNIEQQLQLGGHPRRSKEVVTREDVRRALRSRMRKRPGFMAMVNSSIMKRQQHRIDAIVRFVFCELITQVHKPCYNLSRYSTMLTRKSSGDIPSTKDECPGDDIHAFRCYENYRFALTMENQAVEGYISEKIVNGRLSGAVPVYFGAPDVDEYLNPESFVNCRVSESVLQELRTYENYGNKSLPRISALLQTDPSIRSNYKRKTPFVDNVSGSRSEMGELGYTNPSNEDLLAFGIHLLREELQPCIDQVIALDTDEELYLDKLMAHFYRNDEFTRSKNDGYITAKGIAEVVQLLTVE